MDRKQGRKSGPVDIGGGTHIFADGEEQFGLSLRKFLPDVGTGVDLGFHITQYDSKVPYLRLKGQQGYVAGDFLGLFTLAGAMHQVLKLLLLLTWAVRINRI